MGAERRITAEPPQPKLSGPVARVLEQWRHSNPEQAHLATFGLEHISTHVRHWAPDLEDEVGIWTRWICFGCSFELIYGWFGGMERLVITRLCAADIDPSTDIISELGFAIPSLDRTAFRLIPQSNECIRNCIEAAISAFMLELATFDLCSFAIAAPFDAAPVDVEDATVARKCTFPTEYNGDEFAPPWLPSAYLRAHVPKRRHPRVRLEDRLDDDAGKSQEILMRNFNKRELTMRFPKSGLGKVFSDMIVVSTATPTPMFRGDSPAIDAAVWKRAARHDGMMEIEASTSPSTIPDPWLIDAQTLSLGLDADSWRG